VTRPLIVGDKAGADIFEAAGWYEGRSQGLGSEFIRSIDACFSVLSRNPEMFPEVHRKARMALVRRFPYLVIYKVFPNHITIVAVMHGSRHPNRWKSRK